MCGAPSIVPLVGCRALIAPGSYIQWLQGAVGGLSIPHWARGVKLSARRAKPIYHGWVLYLPTVVYARSQNASWFQLGLRDPSWTLMDRVGKGEGGPVRVALRGRWPRDVDAADRPYSKG
jgi:hypothetical protein